MFDIEKQIDGWRAQLVDGGSMTNADIVELEEHLRETVSDLVAKGLSEHEAFLVGATRLGDLSTLTKEYGKVNGTFVWRKRVLWMLCGYVGGTAFANMIAGVGALAASTAAYSGFGGAPAGMVSIAVAAFCWAGLLVLLFRRARHGAADTTNDSVSLAWMVGFGAMILLGRGLSMVGNVVHAKAGPISEFGESALWVSAGGFVMNLCVMAACLGMMFAFSQKQQEKTESIA